MIRRTYICACYILIFLLNCFQAKSQRDSTIFKYTEYLENILIYHPIAKKADLRITLAKAEMLGAKGALDPIISSGWNQKNFDDKLYFRQYEAKLKFPTILGVDIVGGYENTDGVFLNPDANTDQFGLWHMGIEVNILQGLIINERKTAIDQAKVFQEMAKNEQQIMINDLIYNATTTYLTWQLYSSYKSILEENISIANTYFENTKQSYFNGEKTSLDTLEAYVLYQDAIALIQKNELGLIKSKQNVENYLWFQESPVTLKELTFPENYDDQLFSEVTYYDNANLPNHPIIAAALNKLTYFEIEQRLKREKLKPKLKLKYNPLFSTTDNSFSARYSPNDYKWGFDFAMPILLRSERGDIQKGRVKIEETKLDIENKRNELQNKIESSWEQQNILQLQKVILRQNVVSYLELLNGENEKFNFGESSVFLLNKRQDKYISSQLKLVEVYINQQIEMLNFLYFSNQLIN